MIVDIIERILRREDQMDWEAPEFGNHGKCLREITRLEHRVEIQSQLLRWVFGINTGLIGGITLRLLLIH